MGPDLRGVEKSGKPAGSHGCGPGCLVAFGLFVLLLSWLATGIGRPWYSSLRLGEAWVYERPEGLVVFLDVLRNETLSRADPERPAHKDRGFLSHRRLDGRSGRTDALGVSWRPDRFRNDVAPCVEPGWRQLYGDYFRYSSRREHAIVSDRHGLLVYYDDFLPAKQ